MVIFIIALLWGVFAVLIYRSRKEQGNLFERISIYIYKRVIVKNFLYRILCFHGEDVQRNLMLLHPGESSEYLTAKYYADKIKFVLGVVLCGSILAFCAEMAADNTGIQVRQGQVVRGNKAKEVILEACIEDEETFRETIVLDVEERVLTEREAELLFEEFLPVLEKMILGNNPALQEIREDMNLPVTVEGYPFEIEWNSENSGLLGYDGTVFIEELEEPVLVDLKAVIYYGEQEWNKVWKLKICPPIRTYKEQLIYDLTKMSKEASQNALHDEVFQLPQTLEGKEISWRKVKDTSGNFILLLTGGVAVATYFMKDHDLQKELLKRRKMLKQEYPGMVSKYALYLGAGMTVRGAYQKICGDYYEKKERNAFLKPHPLYEEMLYSCNELKSGVSEACVYERFGRRTGVQEYTRLCTLLNQNLKKGNHTLVQRLREECNAALRESTQFQKRRGEEAETKLLIPMVMLLLMIMLMIMLPAFSGLDI